MSRLSGVAAQGKPKFLSRCGNGEKLANLLIRKEIKNLQNWHVYCIQVDTI
jgi:hypothetical protein